jgi:hypothetical protein
LPSPILDACAFQRLGEGDCPLVNLAIRGTNLAVVVCHAISDGTGTNGHLSVWNWKTGGKKCGKLNIPNYHLSLVFLRDDILLHASLNLSLDLYHIPSSSGDCELPLIERLGLPGLKKLRRYDPRITFANNPIAIPSFSDATNPKATRLFTADNANSILAIEVFTHGSRECMFYNLIVHHHTLLGRADRALSGCDTGHDATPRSVRWEDWGPQMTRIFWFKPLSLCYLTAPCGSQFYVRRSNFIAVYDFCPAGLSENQGLRSPRGDDPACLDGWFRGVVQTKLPFVHHHQTFGGLKVMDWTRMYVDQGRIVGIKNVRLFYPISVLQAAEWNILSAERKD